MGLFDFFGRTKEQKPAVTTEKPREDPPQGSPAPSRRVVLQAEQLRILRGIGILSGKSLAGMMADRIAEDLKALDRARGVADKELQLLAEGDAAGRREVQDWKAGLKFLSDMYRDQVRINQGRVPRRAAKSPKANRTGKRA